MKLRAQQVVAFQGEPGAFGEMAALRYFGADVRTLSCRTFAEVFQAVKKGRAGDGIVPVENSILGSIPQNIDLLWRQRLAVVGEVKLRIRLCLLALPGSTLRDVRTIVSQAQALGQCEKFLRSTKGRRVETAHDTAGSARLVRERGDRSFAAIASRRAAQVYGLRVLREDVEDHPENFTRFLIIRRTPVRPAGHAKTSIVAVVRHAPGSLYGFLGAFADRGINLLSIASRPLPGRPWEYIFHVDVEGAAHTPKLARALKAARTRCIFLHTLGSYRPGRIVNR